MSALYIQQFVLPAAESLLPETPKSGGVTALLLAIGWQESAFEHRRQVRGPARGFWQFERLGVQGVMQHRRTQRLSASVLNKLHYPSDPSLILTVDGQIDAVHTALEHNDVLAACFARLLLFTSLVPLPADTQGETAWQLYRDLWRPGKPRRETWDTHYRDAWTRVHALDTPTLDA